jgi:hypothetical protein
MNEIFVESPPGAGGSFLRSVLGHCTKDLYWASEKRINFHGLVSVNVNVNGNHYYEPAQNIINIDSPNARYNFWINYFRKRIVYELPRYHYQGRRWIKSPNKDSTRQDDGFWILNQCRFIINYRSLQPWKISWTEMLQDPEAGWQVIQEFLDANHQHNYWRMDQWISAVNDYKQTLSKIKINTNHVSWQIWATALLQEQGIIPSFDLIDNFRKPQFFQWLNNYQQNLVETTQKCIWTPG